MALSIIIHGVTTGFDTNESTYPPFIQSFYNRPNGENYFIAEILRDGTGVKSCYTLYVSRNVSNSGNRPGSYFGISVIIDDKVCLDIKALYNALLSTFSNSIVGGVLEKQGDGYRFKFGSFAAAATHVDAAVEKLFGQIQNKLKNALAPIDNNYHLSSGRLTDWNPADLNDDNITAIIKRDGGIILSNELPLQAQRKQLEEERRRRQQEAEAARAEMERQKALSEKLLAEERERTARQARQLADEVKATADRLTRENEARVRDVENRYRTEITALKAEISKKDGVIRNYNDEYKKLADAIEQLNKRIADHQAAGYQGYGSEMKRLADGFNRLSERVSMLETTGVQSASDNSRLNPGPVTEQASDSQHHPNPHSNKKLYLILGGVVTLIVIALIVIFSRGESSHPSKSPDDDTSEFSNKEYVDSSNKNLFDWFHLMFVANDNSDDTKTSKSNPEVGTEIDYKSAERVKIDISNLKPDGNRIISFQPKDTTDRVIVKDFLSSLSDRSCEVTVFDSNGVELGSFSNMGTQFSFNFPNTISEILDCQVEMKYDFGTFKRYTNESGERITTFEAVDSDN